MPFPFRILLSFIAALGLYEYQALSGWSAAHPALDFVWPAMAFGLVYLVTSLLPIAQKTNTSSLDTDSPATVRKEGAALGIETAITTEDTGQETGHSSIPAVKKSVYEAFEMLPPVEEPVIKVREAQTNLVENVEELSGSDHHILSILPGELDALRTAINSFKIERYGKESASAGLPAIAIHQRRIALLYNDETAFTGQLTGYDQMIHTYLTSYLAFLEKCIKSQKTCKELILFYQTSIEPILAGYDRLQGQLENALAREVLAPILETGITIRRHIRSNTFNKSFAA